MHRLPVADRLAGQRLDFYQGARLRAAHRELSRAHAELAAAHRRLAEKSKLDEMTGMLNRESFFAALEGTRRKSDRGALLIIDADHFKKINDNYGHLTGDDALLEITAAIARGVRSGDILGRIGGEEFAAFLVGATSDEARRVAERIRHEVEMIRFRPDREATVPLTVSDRRHRLPAGRDRSGTDARRRPQALRGQAHRPQPAVFARPPRPPDRDPRRTVEDRRRRAGLSRPWRNG